MMENPSWFQELVEGHFDSLYSYARMLTRDQAGAEDLFQETLVRALRGIQTFDRGRNVKVWLFKIMKNAHVDERRRLKRMRPAGLSEEGPRAGRHEAGEGWLSNAPLNPEDILLRRLAIEQVRGAIRHLPPQLREAVELRDIEGLSYQEIADVTGAPLGTVMSRLFRGRNLVRALLLDAEGCDARPRTSRDV
jgi:RNA polymerase sigma-70 factor, ECF subfamily